MSNLTEILETLIFDKDMNLKIFSQKIGIAASSLSNYMNNTRVPTVENLVKIADYFNCSTDFLLGREEENKNLTFNPCPPFHERLEFLKTHFNCKSSYIYKNAGITKSRYFEWQNGKRMPSLDNVIKLANLFDCRVDFVLGREK